VTLAPQTQEEIDNRLGCYNTIEPCQVDELPGGYHKPDGVEINEKFVLKIASYSRIYLLCYDDSRSCCFSIFKGSHGFMELFNKVNPNWKPPRDATEVLHRHFLGGVAGEAETDIIKTRRFYASFNESGDCSVYLETAFY